MIQNFKKRLKNQKGLTLIELLAVIVILGVIAAIAVPSIGGIINKTNEDAKVAEAVQIIGAAKLFVATSPKTTSMDAADLTQYLDNVKDKDFTVTITTVNGKSVYTLNNHDAAPIVKDSSTSTVVTEAELITFSGN